MTLVRAGIVMAVAGGLALGLHARLYVKQARQESDCAAWRRAQRTILRGEGLEARWDWGVSEWGRLNLMAGIEEHDMQALLKAREVLAVDPQWVEALLPALRDSTYVPLRNADNVTVDGRDMPFREHGTFVMDDLFTRAGRASWLLKQATSHPAPIVGVKTNPAVLADVAKDWAQWLEGLEGGAVCSPP